MEIGDKNSVTIAEHVTGRDRIRVMLLARGLEMQEWASSNGYSATAFSMMLNSTRPYPEMRDKLAAALGLTRAEFDEIIPMPSSAAA